MGEREHLVPYQGGAGSDFSAKKESARRAGDGYDQEQVDEGSACSHDVNFGEKI